MSRLSGLPHAAILAATLATSGCVAMHYQQSPLEQSLSRQQPEQALAILEQLEHKPRDAALYHLDKAVLLRMSGDLSASNAELEAAKQISQQLEALSLREQAAAVSVNDAMRSYLPPPFERAMLFCLKMLNYLELGDRQGARVEALQLDTFLGQHYQGQEPPLARYLSGLVFETNGENSDALIAYRKAYQAYRDGKHAVPEPLQADLLRLTGALGLDDEQRRYRDEFALEQWPDQQTLARQGEFIAVVLSGLVPRRHETSIMAQDPRSGQLHRISIPFYESRRADVERLSLSSADLSRSGASVARIDTQAYANLEADMPGIVARAVARVAVKNQLSDNVSQQNPLLGAITNIAGFVTEQADTRAWSTLPQQVLIARLALPPGEHDIELVLQDAAGARVDGETLTGVTLQPGEKRIHSRHWPASHVTSKKRGNVQTHISTTVYHR